MQGGILSSIIHRQKKKKPAPSFYKESKGHETGSGKADGKCGIILLICVQLVDPTCHVLGVEITHKAKKGFYF